MEPTDTIGDDVKLFNADCLAVLPTLAAKSVRCCVTSPPYWGLRDYGHTEQIGLESSPKEYVAKLVAVFREVRRVLADDGTLWLNLGDSFAASSKDRTIEQATAASTMQGGLGGQHSILRQQNKVVGGLKPKDIVGIPWSVAFALRADGWYLRQDIIWSKPNPMPESVTDRCTKAHEYLFLLSKSARYFYDAEAIAEPSITAKTAPKNRWDRGYEAAPGQTQQKRTGRSGNTERKPATERGCPRDGVAGSVPWEGDDRNKRSVWTITTQPFSGAHFAVMPKALVEPCIKAGSEVGDTILDPFGGSGTVAEVAVRLERKAVLCELNAAYCNIARKRIEQVLGIAAGQLLSVVPA